MNWKNVFFISTAFWLGLFILVNCKQEASENEIASSNHSRVTVCNSNDGTLVKGSRCDSIQNRIEAYKLLMDSTAISMNPIKKHKKIITPSGNGSTSVSGAKKNVKVNGITVSWDRLQKELGLLQGFQYKVEDFRSILAYVDSVNQASSDRIESIYTMLAVNASSASIAHRVNNGDTDVLYLDMYFQAVNPTDNSTITFSRRIAGDSGDDAYDNFPLPCPHSCPPGE